MVKKRVQVGELLSAQKKFFLRSFLFIIIDYQ